MLEAGSGSIAAKNARISRSIGTGGKSKITILQLCDRDVPGPIESDALA